MWMDPNDTRRKGKQHTGGERVAVVGLRIHSSKTLVEAAAKEAAWCQMDDTLSAQMNGHLVVKRFASFLASSAVKLGADSVAKAVRVDQPSGGV